MEALHRPHFQTHVKHSPPPLQRVHLLQRLIHARNLPLLETQVRIPHNTLTVDYEQPRPLPQRHHRALHVVLTKDLPVRVRQHRKRDLIHLEVPPGVLHAIRRNRNHFSVALLKIPVPVPQLREMLSAERSAKPPQKHKHNGPSPKSRQRNLAPINRRKRKIRRRRPNRNRLAVYRHTPLLPNRPTTDSLRHIPHAPQHRHHVPRIHLPVAVHIHPRKPRRIELI